MLGLNYSKNIYCDLLEELDQEEMMLLVEDMLTSEVKRGEPIVHQTSLTKVLSLFDNEITDEIGGHSATKYLFSLRYTSTAEKKKSAAAGGADLQLMDNYSDYRQRQEVMVIKEKNRNKQMELEVWLASDFGLKLSKLAEVLQILGAGNGLLGKWSGFLKEKVCPKLSEQGLFPVKIDIPLDYSLYFNIIFANFALLHSEPPLTLKPALERVGRKQYQGLVESR